MEHTIDAEMAAKIKDSYRMELLNRDKNYKLKNYQFLNTYAHKGQILFTGSSLMEQFPIAEIAQNHGCSKIIYNRGIGGYTTDEFIEHIDTVLFDLEPARLFINIGTNDIRPMPNGESWAEHLRTNYDHILAKVQKRLPNTEVFLMAYYPVNPLVAGNVYIAKALETRTNAAIQKANQIVRELADRYHYHFVDANDGLYDEDGNLKATLTKEGLHLYANAYEIVYQNLQPYI